MTEQEWLTCTDPTRLFHLLDRRLGPRKWRLFGVACCHRIRHLLTGELGGKAVEVAELFADGLVTTPELQAAHDAVFAAVQANSFAGEVITPSSQHYAWQAAADVSGDKPRYCWLRVHGAIAWEAGTQPVDPEIVYAWICTVLREMSPYPFRPSPPPLSSARAGNDSTVRRLAQAIYAERAFDRLPILADILEEAGCTDADILNHCRKPGAHVRGCWVVDLLVGKE